MLLVKHYCTLHYCMTLITNQEKNASYGLM